VFSSCIITGMKNNTPFPSIFEFNDFRKFLAEYHQAKHAVDASFSMATVSKLLGLPNTRSYFADVLHGKRVTPAFVERFVRVFELTVEEARFFRVLIKFNQAESAEERELYFDQLISLNKTPKRILSKKSFIYYKNWYNCVIRALLQIIDFTNDYKLLSRKVLPPITVKQAQESIALLLDLGLIAKNEHGFYKPTETSIAAPDFVRDELILQHQLATLENAKRTIIQRNANAYIIATNTISISDTGYKRLAKKIDRFRSEIRSLVHKDESPAERVYQFDIVLYPNSK
jgi:uncharacterized protein (TIGR02147 family)